MNQFFSAASGFGRRLRAHGFALSLAVWTGGCVLSAEGDLPDVEVTQRDIEIPAAPPEADGTDILLAVSFEQKPPRAGINRDAFSDVHVTRVFLSAQSGVSELSFLKSLRVLATTAEAEAAGFAPIEIGNYQQPAGGGGGTFIELISDPPIDVTELWRSKRVKFTLEVFGRLPPVAWTANIGINLGATLSYDL